MQRIGRLTCWWIDPSMAATDAEEPAMNTEVAPTDAAAPWRDSPYVLSWNTAAELPYREVEPMGPNHSWAAGMAAPPWVGSGPTDQAFDFCRAVADVLSDICRHVTEFSAFDSRRILIGFLQARHARGHGLQARVTPLRFHGGQLVRTARGRLFQVQRFIVADVEMLYVMTFCLPRFLDQSFDQKMVTLFHELFHIGPNFDGDLRRHPGRCSMHTSSKNAYDEHMAQLARNYLAGGANPQLHGFLRLSYAQLRARHSRVVAVKLPRPKILAVPVA
jgi:predicted metallopeptidase